MEQRPKAQRITNMYKIRNDQVVLDNHEHDSCQKAQNTDQSTEK